LSFTIAASRASTFCLGLLTRFAFVSFSASSDFLASTVFFSVSAFSSSFAFGVSSLGVSLEGSAASFSTAFFSAAFGVAAFFSSAFSAGFSFDSAIKTFFCIPFFDRYENERVFKNPHHTAKGACFFEGAKIINNCLNISFLSRGKY
jgi:hypothetical protein